MSQTRVFLKLFYWPDNIAEAKAVQLSLKRKVRIAPLKKHPRLIAALDASFIDDKAIGVACLYRYPELALLECSHAFQKTAFPYIPGYLTFREGPALVSALEGLKIRPDLILVDGQGIAHPKGMGIASHLGVLLDIPSIGCAKSRLVGEFVEPGPNRGDWTHLRYNGKIVGAVLRTRDHVKPVFVSPGHRIDLKTAIEIILVCMRKYRIPEPLRKADSVTKSIKREFSAL